MRRTRISIYLVFNINLLLVTEIIKLTKSNPVFSIAFYTKKEGHSLVAILPFASSNF